jgi:hypothetical protein
MRRLWILSFAVSLVLGGAGSARADDKELKALIEKAVKAAGGEEKLTKFKAATWKSKGTYHGMGVAIPYTAEWAVQRPGQFRAEITSDVDGNKFTFAIVFNRDKGWRKFGNDTQEMDKDMLAEQKQELHAQRVTTLVPLLKDKEITLSALGDSKIDNRPAVGVKVSQKGYRDVHLFFDKENYRLLKSEGRVKDDMSGQEVNQEALYSEYKDVDGVMHPMKVVIKRDGKLYVEDETTEYKPLEKLDDSVFGKP